MPLLNFLLTKRTGISAQCHDYEYERTSELEVKKFENAMNSEIFSLTSENYASAVELLKRRFGRPNIIQRARINERLNVPGIYKERDTGRL